MSLKRVALSRGVLSRLAWVVFFGAGGVALAAGAEGIRPAGADGQPLNLGFEDGTFKDWKVEGDAFGNAPVRGDAVFARRADMRSKHAGEYWAGSYEAGSHKGMGDDLKGTLVSVPFKVEHRWASFGVAGGSANSVRVELATADDGNAFLKTSGTNGETLRPVVVDLEKQTGKQIVIRVVDDARGAWGHINFDDFLFYDERPKFENELTPAPAEAAKPVADVVKFAGLSPADAVKAMTLPPGFSATVFAAEPDVVQPIAFTIDARGRLWVVEGLTYPTRAKGDTTGDTKEDKGADRILIFEDTDGDGRADKHIVFAEHLNLVSGIEVGFGGVFVGAAPYLMFIPDRDGDDKPDAAPEILLDGWGYQDTHETLNTFTWGPDGWLYGCQGVFTHSKVAKPGTPDEQRVKINAGVWRYHPTKKTFEVFAEGTSNPWGIDFDANGQLIAEACVIPHLWHVVQGGRYQRQAGQHFNPYTFDDIKQSADHVHYAGAAGPHAGNGRSDAAGGGHAHAGLMVYNGNAWPDEYKGKIFIGNIHGQRINMDIPEPKGSGFVGRHGADFLNFNDTWSQIINFKSGPDGNVYFIDWYDAQQCHVKDPTKHDRGNGRIFKVSYGASKQQPVDLAKLSDNGLRSAAANGNQFTERTARRLLQERAASGALKPFAGSLPTGADEVDQLRTFWMWHACRELKKGHSSNEAMEAQLLGELRQLGAPQHVIASAIQLLCEERSVSSEVLQRFAQLSKDSKSSVVRLALASGIGRLPPGERWDVLAGLLSHFEDAADHNLPLMYWYAGEPLAAVDPERAMKLALSAKVPPFLSFMTRRIALIGDERSVALLTATLDATTDDARRLEVLRGLTAAFAGQRDVPVPQTWDATAARLAKSESAEVRQFAEALSVTFGSRAAMDRLRKTVSDTAAAATDRTAAIDSLARAKDPAAVPMIQGLLADKAVRGAALRALAAFDDAKTPDAIVNAYADFSPGEKRDALNTLASRPAYAEAIFAAVEAKTLPASDVTADLVRQLRNLGNAAIDARLAKTFATRNQTPDERLKQIAAVKAMLTAADGAGGAQPGDAVRGRAIFGKTCQQCHALFDAGGDVGPNITGANRADLDYLLLNILDPNALIPAEYATTIVRTKDGRTLSGIVRKQDDNTLTLAAANETVTLPRKDVSKMKVQDVSMMPEGLLDPLTDAEKRDLVAYLQSPRQVPMPATAENAKTFFNGKDLTGWWGKEGVWKVEGGELVGKTDAGLGNNEFLKSNLLVKNFRMTFKVKLVPHAANSGFQFRSVPLENSPEMKGYQADIGAGWWGKLYHESGRGLLWDKGGDDIVKKDDWNTYEILAVGHKIRTAINGKLCVNLDDPAGELEGVCAVQVHSGGPTEVRFKDFELEVDPKPVMKTVK